MHSVTDRRTDRQTGTDGQQAAANSRSYCVAVRSAKNEKWIFSSQVSALRFDEFFEAESQHTQSRTRGHSWKIVKQRNCLDLRKYFFSARVVDRWNRLDQKHIDIDTVNGFKKRLENKRNTTIDFKASLDCTTPFLVWPHQVNIQDA